jgi:hypothetical protein
MITKNILYKYFKDFADNHLQIKDYGYGDLWEISSSQATTYPLFWVSPQPSNISGNDITYNFNILIGDRLEDGDANKVEVESDTFQIGLDLLATLNLHTELDLEKSNSLTPFIHDFKDRIAGHLITLSVSAPFDYNECAVPTTGTPQPPATSCPGVVISINGVNYGTIGSGNSEDIAVVDTNGSPIGSLISGNWVITGSTFNIGTIDKFGNVLPTIIVTSSQTINWKSRDYRDVFLSNLTAPTSGKEATINALCDSLVSANLMSKLRLFNPFLGSNANDNSLNLAYPFLTYGNTDRLRFFNSPIHGAGFLEGTGTQYAMAPINNFTMDSNNFSFGFYSLTNAIPSGVAIDMGWSSSSGNGLYLSLSTAPAFGGLPSFGLNDYFSRLGTSMANGGGLIMGHQNATTRRFTQGTTILRTASNGGEIGRESFGAWCGILIGTNSIATRRMGATFVGEHLNATDLANLNTIMQTLMTNKGVSII